MLSIMCFYYAKKGHWPATGALGFLLALTRSIGVLIIIPLVLVYLSDKGFGSKDIRPDAFLKKAKVAIKPDILSLLLIPLAIVIFMAYDYFMTGDFLKFVHIQSVYGAELTNPLVILVYRIYMIFKFPAVKTLPVFMGACFAMAILLGLTIFYKKVGLPYWILGVYSIFVPLSAGSATMFSFPRYALVIFPVYILLAELGENKYFDMVAIPLFIILQAVLMALWTQQILWIL